MFWNSRVNLSPQGVEWFISASEVKLQGSRTSRSNVKGLSLNCSFVTLVWQSEALPLNLMHTSTDFELIIVIPGLGRLTSVTFQQLKTGWLAEEFGQVSSLHATWTPSKATSCAIVLNWFIKPGLLKFWLLLGLSDQVSGSSGLLNATPCRLCSWFRALTAWTINYKLYCGAKWSTTFLPMQRNADLMFLVWRHKPDLVLKCLNCDDLYECTKCFFFVCWSYVLFFCHWGLFFLYTLALLCFVFVNIATLFCCFLFMCNNCFYLIYFTF